ncbi:MAG: divalent-cation tolerance protein CutA [Actinomycetota bacterium]|nr:divalent-cation tolerance protein CutA [Actinomycetota bacterium]
MTATGSEHEAEAIADALVNAGLAACVQRSPIVSHYRWQGQATRSEEILLLIKTTAERVPEVMASINSHHSYDTPEILELPISSGWPAYLAWIDQSVS